MSDKPSFTLRDDPPETPEQKVAKAIEEELVRLAALSPVEYDRARDQAAQTLGIRLSTLDEQVEKRRPKEESAGATVPIVADPEPHAEQVPLSDALYQTAELLGDHIKFSFSAAIACTLWCAHTYVFEQFDFTPRLLITGPTKRVGKSTLLTAIARLSRRAFKADNVTAAVLFRMIEKYSPTLLLDEADTWL